MNVKKQQLQKTINYRMSLFQVILIIDEVNSNQQTLSY